MAFGGSLHPEIRDLPGRMNHRMPRLPNGEKPTSRFQGHFRLLP